MPESPITVGMANSILPTLFQDVKAAKDKGYIKQIRNRIYRLQAHSSETISKSEAQLKFIPQSLMLVVILAALQVVPLNAVHHVLC